MDKHDLGTFYNEYYYTHCCGVPYKRDDGWMRFFNTIAKEIKINICPKTVLDAGCAMGFLVESLRQQDVETWGIDISEYAIQNAHPSIQPYCSVGSVTEEFPRRYDLIVCIEVLEHLTRQQAEQAIKNFCQHTDDILFSSSPLDYKEATHFNVQPSEYWAEQFAKQGFIRDVDFDASFITPWAVRFRRNHEPLHRIIREYERILWLLRKENLDLRESVLETYKQIETLEKTVQELTAKVVDLNSQLEQYQSQLQKTQLELEHWKSQEQKTQSQLEHWKSQLQKTQLELEHWKSQEQKTQLEIEHWKYQLQKTQSELEERKYHGQKSQSDLQKTQAKLQDSQSQLQKTQAELEISKSELIYAQTLITAMQTSKFWRLRTAWFKVKGLLNLVSDLEIFTDNKVLNIVNKTEDILKNSNSSQKKLSPDNSLKMFAFISGCPGDAYRYRCHHQAEILNYLGYTVDVYEPMVFLYSQLLIKYKIIIAHRVPHTYEFEQFVFKAKKLGIKVIFDTDDLVFDPSCLSQIHAYTQMDEQEKTLYENGVKRYRKSMSLCDYITVSTDKLQQKIKESFPNKFLMILRNRISNEMEQGAIEARKCYVPNDGMLRIAYFSGTKTHVQDFAECVLALKSILTKFPYVRLMIVGHLDIPEALQEVASQIECIPYMPWRDLPALYRKVDINLAPLEKNNDFTEAKSELKYFEAALLSVPTIASDTSAFRIAIQNGVNGLLCNNLIEWENAMYQLVTNHKLRQEMGHKAFEDTNSRYLTRVAALETLKGWSNLLGGSLLPNKPLAIAFILRAPIAQTGGGYKQIFYLAHYLAEHGHHVDIYVEPIAHLTDFTPEQVKQFCDDNFGKSPAIIHCGHANILDSDVAIATNWPTAEVVNQLINTRFKAYFIQDYEPYFYEPEDICFKQAEATYDLPLGMICIGKYLAEVLSKRNRISYSYIDFSLNEAFLAKDPSLYRHLSTDKPCSILFFARPHIPRRNFALGVEALNKLYRHNSDVQIKLYGLEEALELPFPYENLGVLTQGETAEAMRSSDIHLSFSMTNISTVVFEAMACGCATIEVDVPPVRAMVKEGTCLLSEPNSEAVFNALMNLVNNAQMRQKVATAGYESVQHLKLQNMCLQFEEILMEYSFKTKNLISIDKKNEASDLSLKNWSQHKT
ncbi:glycosyltransferase [Nostoc sp. CHAB 5836]|uniref:rhamnosyltransferase WsaF family glycosyltransferase n=1 Tax=Nostoc sp. CHAB 5836 TaxID=2780404 RepID=UPI001E50848A|nr:glycosyltransferase [Nostoc sp. CHAB 5836]MCC5617186.1 glycosyltransferase [Nostoc sp. CHAB 5836]